MVGAIDPTAALPAAIVAGMETQRRHGYEHYKGVLKVPSVRNFLIREYLKFCSQPV